MQTSKKRWPFSIQHSTFNIQHSIRQPRPPFLSFPSGVRSNMFHCVMRVTGRAQSGTVVAAPSDRRAYRVLLFYLYGGNHMLTDFIRLFLGLKRAVREAKKARRPNLRRIRPAEYILSDSGHWRLVNPEEYLSESGVWRLAS